MGFGPSLEHAQVAQLVEHATENRSVGGSIPPLGTKLRRYGDFISLRSIQLRVVITDKDFGSCSRLNSGRLPNESADSAKSGAPIKIQSLENNQRAPRDQSCGPPHEWSVDAG
jgi:hypothetical protein